MEERRRADKTTGITMDGIRALLQQQTQDLRESQDLKRRLIALAQQIRFAAVQAHSMENGKHLRASLGKSRQERLLSNHIAKTKRLILTVKPGESGKVEADYSASNIWYQNNLVASASRPKPNALVDQGHAPRSWIDLVLLSKLLHVDTSELREQWADLIGRTAEGSSPFLVQSLIPECEPQAKRSRSEQDWKRAHKARREAQDAWRKKKLEKAAACNWAEYRSTKQQGGSEWAVGFVEEAEIQNKSPLRWTVDHFRTLFQQTEPREVPAWTKEVDSGSHFTVEELEAAVQRGKGSKAVGEDLVSFELLKELAKDKPTAQALLAWMERLRCGEPLPDQWLRTIVTLLPKKDQVKSPADLRPISLGSAASKLFGTMLLFRTRQHIGPIGPAQCAHGGRQTADYVHAALRSFSLDTEWKLGMSWCRIDIRKAFDTVGRDKALRLLRDRLPPSMYSEYRCWERLFHEGTAVLRTPWGEATVPQSRGIRQGSVESPFLFAVAIEQALYNALSSKDWPSFMPAIPDLPLSELLYMDDTLLWAASKQDMQKKYCILRDELAKWGLKVNAEKTQYYHSPFSTSPGPIALDGQVIECSSSMGVFGIQMSVPIKPSTLMDAGIAKGTAKFWANKQVFLARAPLKQKLKLFNSVVTGSALWYCCSIPPTAQAMGVVLLLAPEAPCKPCVHNMFGCVFAAALLCDVALQQSAAYATSKTTPARPREGFAPQDANVAPPRVLPVTDARAPQGPPELRHDQEHPRRFANENSDETHLQQLRSMLLLAAGTVTYGFKEAFPDERTPDWYWDLIDMGEDICRNGTPHGALSQALDEAALGRLPNQPDYFLETEHWRNGLHKAWSIVCRGHEGQPDLPIPPGLEVHEFAALVEQALRHQWLRLQFPIPDPGPPSSSCSTQGEQETSRSRSPCRVQTCRGRLPDATPPNGPQRPDHGPPLRQVTEAQHGPGVPAPLHDPGLQHELSPRESEALNGPEKEGHPSLREPQVLQRRHTETDVSSLVADRWLLKPRSSLPKKPKAMPRKTTETIILRAPWKRGGNPPHRGPSPPRPRPPKTAPPTTSRHGTCTINLENQGPKDAEDTDDDPVEEVVVESNNTECEGAIEVWQALLEFEPREALPGVRMPVLPQSVMDNIVETLIDKPASEYEHMLTASATFVSRLAEDIGVAMERAKALRKTLRDRASSSKGPDHDESLLMQTSLHESLRSTLPTILTRLQDEFRQLSPGAAVARAQKLRARLEDHEGRLAVDRDTLNAALLTFAEGAPEQATGDRYICEWGWISRWWAILEGSAEYSPNSPDLNFLENVFPEDPTQAMDVMLAAQIAHEQEEDLYHKGLEEAVHNHINQSLPEDETGTRGETKPAETGSTESGASAESSRGTTDNSHMPPPHQLSDYQWKPGSKRLCLGICLTNGTRSKAWDYELDTGTQVDLHIRAQRRELPGHWEYRGKPVPYEQLPRELQAQFTREAADKARGSQEAPPLPAQTFSMNMDRPATRELYDRWVRGVLSDQAVREVGGESFLQFFQICAGLSEDTLCELEADRPPHSGDPATASTAPANPVDTVLDDGGDTPAPEALPVPLPTPSTTSTSTTSALGTPSSFPDAYFDGAEYWRRYGHMSSEEESWSS
ncbi:unnamed protein product [Symbiodinium microadriaticum]|nr:unnamed protein product [Symbiodinium microadriaticum]